MAATYTLIESYTVGAGGASSVTLGSGGTIPQTYTDLQLLVSVRTTGSSDPTVRIRFNSNSSNYTYIQLYANGSAAYSGTQAGVTSGTTFMYGGYGDNSGNTANTFSNHEIYIPNYTSSNYKSCSIDSVNEDNSSSALQFLVAGLWSDTSAITSIVLSQGTDNYAQYSTFYLYGIKNS